jgi:hypothetical protein
MFFLLPLTVQAALTLTTRSIAALLATAFMRYLSVSPTHSCSRSLAPLVQVGVHIADVSHFIRPGTAIDAEACKRGTTVYLTNRR